MNRLRCWLDGHDYIFALGTRFREPEILAVTVCMRCGARHAQPEKELRRE